MPAKNTNAVRCLNWNGVEVRLIARAGDSGKPADEPFRVIMHESDPHSSSAKLV